MFKIEKIEELKTAIKNLYLTVKTLRSPNGCPWDREQTHESLKASCVEETVEVLCGINILCKEGKPENLCEELGDLLLQIIMHSQIAEENGMFSLIDVINNANNKMIYRHPSVFSEKNEDDLTNHDTFLKWKDIKATEHKDRSLEYKYLRGTFDEVIELVDIARKRKGIDRL